MHYQNAEIHGAGELVPMPGGGVRLQRVPESVRMQLDDPGRKTILNPAGMEIRFVVNSGPVRVTVSSCNEEVASATLFHGTHASLDEPWSIGPEPRTFEIAMPQGPVGERFDSLPGDIADRFSFHPRVCRLVLRLGQIVLHSIEGDIRPPTAAELPSRTMMAYGTSITQGWKPSAFHLSYVAQTAWRLNTDLLNFGVGGACFAEPAFADYLAALKEWDFATLELSVNMWAHGFTVDRFRERVEYFVRTVAGSNPDKPVFCISIYPFFGDWAPGLQPNARCGPDELRDAYQEIIASLALSNTHFLDGRDILPDASGLTADMIHPGDAGMITMGENLAGRIAHIDEGVL